MEGKGRGGEEGEKQMEGKRIEREGKEVRWILVGGRSKGGEVG